MAYDNCQEGIQLTLQRVGKSSRLKKATTVELLEWSLGMPSFEDINASRVDCLLMNSNVSHDNAPEMSGSRVKAYMDLLLSADVMKTIDHCVAKDVVASHIPPKRKLSHDETQAQAEIFLKALPFVIEGPGEVNCTPKSSTPPSMTPEKQIIYEMLVRANAHTYVPNRTMNIKLLFDVMDLCTTDLKRSDLESERTKDVDLDDLILAVAQVSANDIPENMDPMDGEFASFERTNVNNDTDVADEAKHGTVMIDGTKEKNVH
eukprot:scaffold9688_cov60-Attheya_sp.AAC.1